jgi:hypothetical protein
LKAEAVTIPGPFPFWMNQKPMSDQTDQPVFDPNTAANRAQDMLQSMPPDDEISKRSGGLMSGDKMREALEHVAGGGSVSSAFTSQPSKAAKEKESRRLEAAMAQSLSDANWKIGELLALWMPVRPPSFPKLDPLQTLAAQLGQTPAGLEIRLKVWDRFHTFRETHPALSWPHFQIALQWSEREANESLSWAQDMGATPAEMRAWHRAQFTNEPLGS